MIWKNQNGLNLIIFEDLDNRIKGRSISWTMVILILLLIFLELFYIYPSLYFLRLTHGNRKEKKIVFFVLKCHIRFCFND